MLKLPTKIATEEILEKLHPSEMDASGRTGYLQGTRVAILNSSIAGFSTIPLTKMSCGFTDLQAQEKAPYQRH